METRHSLLRGFPLAAAALSVAFVALPVAPVHGQETLGEKIERHMTKENVGRAVGAAAGALLGSQIGGGRGKLAAVAVGTLAGYWIGGKVGRHLSESDRQGIATTTQQALDSGQSQTWRNPDTGVVTNVSVSESAVAGNAFVDHVPPLLAVNEYFRATTRVNVRGGPGTGYRSLGVLDAGQRAAVIGQVAGSEWMMVTSPGTGAGFTHGGYLERTLEQPVSGSAIRDALAMAPDGSATAALPSTAPHELECRTITQQVTLPDGASNNHQFVACQRPDGTWEQTG